MGSISLILSHDMNSLLCHMFHHDLSLEAQSNGTNRLWLKTPKLKPKNFSAQDICLFCLLTEIDFIFWSIIRHYLFCCSHCSSFGHWELFQLASVSLLRYSHHYAFINSWSTFLLFGTKRYFRLILFILCTSPKIS
jgi:hypothetical protein